jgi:hypothetical protein
MSYEHPKQGTPTESPVTYKGGADGKSKAGEEELTEEEQPRKQEGEEREQPSPSEA